MSFFCDIYEEVVIKTFLFSASKLRNSFVGSVPEIKSARRPTSIISVGSMSSGTSGSSSSVGTSIGGTNSESSASNHNNSTNINFDLNNETCVSAKGHRKHQRSTTLVSQCSMGKVLILTMI